MGAGCFVNTGGSFFVGLLQSAFFMSTIKITTTQNIDIEYQLAGLGERIVGNIIDSLIKFAYAFVVYLAAIAVILNRPNVWPFVMLLVAIPFLFYDLASEIFMNGQSIGKRIMNIKVVSLDGVQSTTGQYILRWLFRPIDMYITLSTCAVLTIGLSERNQRLGDMVAGTIVIRTVNRTSFQQTIYVPPVQQPDYNVTFPEAVNLTDNEMQLVKDVIVNMRETGNTYIAYQAAEKIKQTLQISNTLEPLPFLQLLLADYNYLTSMA